MNDGKTPKGNGKNQDEINRLNQVAHQIKDLLKAVLGPILEGSMVFLSQHEGRSIAWTVIDHTKSFEQSAVGYHCPKCGHFYTEGLYTIEGLVSSTDMVEPFVLCYEEEMTHCELKLPSPVVFFKPDPALKFLQDFASGEKKLRAVSRSGMIEAHFRRGAVH